MVLLQYHILVPYPTVYLSLHRQSDAIDFSSLTNFTYYVSVCFRYIKAATVLKSSPIQYSQNFFWVLINRQFGVATIPTKLIVLSDTDCVLPRENRQLCRSLSSVERSRVDHKYTVIKPLVDDKDNISTPYSSRNLFASPSYINPRCALERWNALCLATTWFLSENRGFQICRQRQTGFWRSLQECSFNQEANVSAVALTILLTRTPPRPPSKLPFRWMTLSPLILPLIHPIFSKYPFFLLGLRRLACFILIIFHAQNKCPSPLSHLSILSITLRVFCLNLPLLQQLHRDLEPLCTICLYHMMLCPLFRGSHFLHLPMLCTNKMLVSLFEGVSKYFPWTYKFDLFFCLKIFVYHLSWQFFGSEYNRGWYLGLSCLEPWKHKIDDRNFHCNFRFTQACSHKFAHMLNDELPD